MERDIATLRENVAMLNRRLFREIEKRLPLMAELAMTAVDTPKEADEPTAATIRRAAYPLLPTADMGTPLPMHERHLAALRSTLGTVDRVAYIQALLSLLKERGQTPSLSDLLPLSETAGARIAYVKNAYTDEAYESFADRLPSPTVRYCDSFRAACEELVSEEADFCILPYRSSAGRLASFSELAEHYALYICALCRVFHADGTDVSHFALYSRTLPQKAEHEATHLRFSFLATDTDVMSQHITAAAMLGLSLTELTAEPYAAGDGALLCTGTAVAATTEKQDWISWLLYLLVFTDGGVCHGLYKEI